LSGGGRFQMKFRDLKLFVPILVVDGVVVVYHRSCCCCLPLVGGAVVALLPMLLGLANLVHDVHVLGVEGDNLKNLVELVPELGGLQELLGRHGTLTGRPGYTVELAAVAPGVEQEAHPSGQINLIHSRIRR